MLPFVVQSFAEQRFWWQTLQSVLTGLLHLFGGQELLSDSLQGYETYVLLANSGAAKCSELSWCLPERNNRKALKLQSAHVPLTPTQLPPCKTRDLLGAGGGGVRSSGGEQEGEPLCVPKAQGAEAP